MMPSSKIQKRREVKTFRRLLLYNYKCYLSSSTVPFFFTMSVPSNWR